MRIYPALALLFVLTMPLTCIAQAASSLPPVRDTASATILVGAGTAVPVHVVGALSSGSGKEGDIFQIQVADDVVLNNMVVFRKGAGGQGHITKSDSAGGNGHSGAMALAFDYVYASDGNRVHLSDSAQNQAEEDRKGASSTATIVGYATLGLGGLFAQTLPMAARKQLLRKQL